MWRRRKSWLGWKHVMYQFTLWCSNSRWLNLSLYESKSWLWFKLWNASFLRLTKLTSVPSDFALIVNLGVYSDALMIMKQSRTRLVTISCASQRLELLLKDAVKENPQTVASFIQHFPLFKNSGKLKTDEKNSASVHNISDYLLCEIHGTTIYNTLA